MPEKNNFEEVSFINQTKPRSYFEILQIEELLERKLDHDILNNHIVNFYILFFVLEGKGIHTIDFKEFPYNKGTVLLIRKDQIHKFHKSKTVKGYLLIFTDEFIVSHLNEQEALRSLQIFNELIGSPIIDLSRDKQSFRHFAGHIAQLKQEYQIEDDVSTGITRSLLHILIAQLFRVKSQNGNHNSNKYLSQFLILQEMVEKDCFESKKVLAYAKKMGVSSKTVNNIVQSVLNKSAKAFIDEIVIMQIKRLLISTDHSIKEIGYEAGFDDPAHFFKYFKKFVHVSPEAFRKANR